MYKCTSEKKILANDTESLREISDEEDESGSDSDSDSESSSSVNSVAYLRDDLEPELLEQTIRAETTENVNDTMATLALIQPETYHDPEDDVDNDEQAAARILGLDSQSPTSQGNESKCKSCSKSYAKKGTCLTKHQNNF